MAEASDSDLLYLDASEKLQQTVILKPGSEFFSFEIQTRESKLNVKAGSSFEAALKTSFVLSNLALLDNDEQLTCKFEGTEWIYQVEIDENVPRVILRSTTKAPRLSPTIGEDTMEARESLSEHREQRVSEETNANGSNDLLQVTLEKFFGHSNFKPKQRETISATMSGKNVLAVIGTGGGKSLTFMLPAVLATKPTLVVSPTRSLRGDLLSRSENNGIKSCMFLGGMDTEVLQHQKQTFKQYNLVYATPEALEQHLLEGLTEGDLSVERVVFDEAHTINTWGSTFRPKYREVSEKLARLDAPKLLLSATIPGKIQADLKQLLGGESWKVVAHTVHRENLTLRVKDRDSKYMEELIAYIRERGEDTGIVYCVSQNDVSKIHAELHKKDIKCVKYHGQLSEAVKQASFQKWMSGECKVIVANSSFGMGTDKTDVRYVVQSSSYQPLLRSTFSNAVELAGMASLPIACYSTATATKSMLYKLFNREGLITRQHYTLNELISYLENVGHCRHKIIMEYFGEERQDFSCLTKCDNCLSRGSFCLADGTSEASKVVQTVGELGNRKVNANMLKLILIGSKQKKVQDAGCDELANFGCLSKKMPSILLDKFVHMLIHQQILSEIITVSRNSFVINVALGPKAHDLLGGQYTCTKFVPS